MKIRVQRLIEVWIEDSYEVEDTTEESIDKALNYELDADSTEVLWDSQEDLYPVKVYDEEYNLIKEKTW